ncbi:MAG: hypothetical protein WBL41_20740, partial [Terracidiphilus sp.]
MKAPSVAAILFFCAALAPAFAPALSKDSQNSTPVATATPIVYRNTQYGFCFRLPADWKGYKIVTVPGVRVPELLIQHPKWTADDPRPEIPIMVFTREQWKLGESSDMNWNVAGLEPTEIGRNQSYVFAQPPGWIESEDAEGMDEVRTLMLQNPFEAPCGPPIVYHNAQYDFCFRLPASWKGYTIVTDKWSGGIAGTGDNPKMMQRPLILIRNPEWTEEDPWQDIPIMVFTRAQWRVKEKNGVILSAAGVDVGAIGQNS